MAFDKDKIEFNYSTDEDNVLGEFYIPVLKEAISYDRAVGYFSTHGLLQFLQGIDGLIKNNGKMRLVIGDTLSDDEYHAIKNTKEFKGVFERLDKKWSEIFNNKGSDLNQYRLQVFSWLVNRGYLEIRYAFRRKGLFHKKIGIVSDVDGEKIAFSGSINETESALISNQDNPDGNSEEFSVFPSWEVENFERYGQPKVDAFNKVWDDDERNTVTVDLPSYQYEKIKNIYTNSSAPSGNIESKQADLFDKFFYTLKKDDESQCIGIPSFIELREYQKNVINNWFANQGVGVVQMATGTGKTITAISAATTLVKEASLEILVVICPYKHLANQWVEELSKFNFDPISAYIKASKWLKDLNTALTYPSTNCICIVTTSSTFVGDAFQSLVRRFPKKSMIIGDEVHNYGSAKMSRLLPDSIMYRMGLSATPERWFDPEGTQDIFNYFGELIKPVVTLEDALEWGVLTKYYYYPIIVQLDDEEYEEYEEVTTKIGKLVAMGHSVDEATGPLNLLLIKRARIISSCKNKIPKLVEIMNSLDNPSKFLIYCGDGKVDSSSSTEEVRQIDEVTKVLGNNLGIKVSMYTAETTPDERNRMQVEVASGKISGIVAIRCLDEGVDIPEVEMAIILASSSNPKQFIQRRGRILRRAPGKDKSIIYDLIVTPPSYATPSTMDRKLVEKELKRCMEFADLAENMASARESLIEIQKRYDLLSL